MKRAIVKIGLNIGHTNSFKRFAVIQRSISGNKVIDLKSDTVTKPSNAMRAAMVLADVGDDVYNEDPSMIALEQRVALMFNKDASLFFPTGTMSNLTAVMTWCNVRGAETIAGDSSHIFQWEQAGASQFGGISIRTVPNLPNGIVLLLSYTFYQSSLSLSSA